MREYRMLIYIFLLLSPYVTAESPTRCFGKQLLGKIEKVILVDKNVVLDAKMDTGADMSSLSASNMRFFMKENRKWVQFNIAIPKSNKNEKLIKPIIRFVNIRKRRDEITTNKKINYFQRPVVLLAIKLGNKQKIVPCNLINREHFNYQMILGAEALKLFNAVVDVGQYHLAR